MKVGIDLGGSHIAIGVVDSKGKIVEKIEKRITSIEKKEIKNSIETYIIENSKQMMKRYKVTGVGIAIPGTLSNDRIIKSVNLGIKEEYDLVKQLKKYIKVPIKIKNDAKCAALAEDKKGCLKGFNRSVFLTLGTGIGGAVIINGKLLDTGDLPGCEFGHMIIEKDGRICNCGNRGCFEAYSSMKVLKNNIRKELGLDESTRGEELLAMIRKNKKGNNNYEKIEKPIEDFIEYLSIGISNLVNIFEPEAIGIGGSFVFFDDVLLNRLKENIIKKDLLFNPRKELIITPAVLRNDAGIIGSTLI